MKSEDLNASVHDKSLGIRRKNPGRVCSGCRVRHDPVGLHVAQELIRDLSQHLLGQVKPGNLRVQARPEEVSERNELHDVAGCHSAVGGGQPDCIAILKKQTTIRILRHLDIITV